MTVTAMPVEPFSGTIDYALGRVSELFSPAGRISELFLPVVAATGISEAEIAERPIARTSTSRSTVETPMTATPTSSPEASDDTPPESSPAELLDELVREHLDAVYRVAFSVVRDSALAEDVSQDAILKAWKALPTFRGDSSLRSWVLRITHNTAISTLRKRREELRDPDLLPETETRSTTESQVEGRMSISAFEDALNQLDDLSRSIVVLREIEGFSYDEISQMLDVPLPTVKTRLLRSRRVLAAALEDWRP